MPTISLSFLRFHLFRLWREVPVAFMALVFGALALVAAAAIWVVQWQRAADAEQAVHALMRTPARAGHSTDPAQPALPDFNSAEFVAMLMKVADRTSLPVDEISFALDDAEGMPYLRYRVKLAVTSRYPVVRRFADQFRAELAHVSLDAIHCRRENLSDVDVNCDLALSAFFRKPARG